VWRVWYFRGCVQTSRGLPRLSLSRLFQGSSFVGSWNHLHIDENRCVLSRRRKTGRLFTTRTVIGSLFKWLAPHSRTEGMPALSSSSIWNLKSRMSGRAYWHWRTRMLTENVSIDMRGFKTVQSLTHKDELLPCDTMPTSYIKMDWIGLSRV